jgi:hypothetical protein
VMGANMVHIVQLCVLRMRTRMVQSKGSDVLRPARTVWSYTMLHGWSTCGLIGLDDQRVNQTVRDDSRTI